MGAEVTGDPVFMTLFGIAAAREGRPAEGSRLLDQLEQLRRERYVEPSFVLALCSGLKDTQQRTVWGRRFTEDHSTLVLYQPLIDKFWAGILDAGQSAHD